jgi:zinc-ribbon domain
LSSQEEGQLDVVHILRVLWRRKLWVAGGVVLAAFVAWSTAFKVTFPPSFESKSIEFGVASTQVLLDAGRSPFSDIGTEIEPLAVRAQVYARLVESLPASRMIAEEAGVEPGSIVITGHTATAEFTRSSREPTAEQRAQQLGGEANLRRILFSAEEDLPVLAIFAQAPTPEEAIRLADAGATGLIRYAETLQDDPLASSATRVEVQQLGDARGGWVNRGASRALALLAFVGVLIVWCFLVLLGSNLVENLRRQGSHVECANCGLELTADARFCPRCGAVTAQPPSPAAPGEPVADGSVPAADGDVPQVAAVRRSA